MESSSVFHAEEFFESSKGETTYIVLSITDSETTVLKSETRAVKSETTVFKSETRAVESETTAFKSETRAVESETTVFKSETTTAKSESTSSHSESEILTILNQVFFTPINFSNDIDLH
jgi:hypothetical protein